MPKNLADVVKFLEQEWLASFATVDAHGGPHVVPVWFTYEHSTVHVQTDRKSVKVRNISKNDSVAVAVCHGEEAVIIRGTGRVVEDEKQFAELTQRYIDSTIAYSMLPTKPKR